MMTIIVAVASLAFCCLIILYFINFTKSLCNIATFVTALFVLDVILPMLYYILCGKSLEIWYYPVLTLTDYTTSFYALLLGYIVFIVSYRLILKPCKIRYAQEKKEANNPIYVKLSKSFYLFFLVYFFGIVIDIMSMGSLKEYYIYSVTRAVSTYIEYSNSVIRYIRLICGFCLMPCLIVSALCINYEKNRAVRIIKVILTLFLALSTMSRGTIVNYFIMVVVVMEAKEISFQRIKKRAIKWIILGLVAFIAFTGIRGIMNSARWGDTSYREQSFFIYMINQFFLSTGSSLNAVARICHHLRDGGDIFGGLSFWELLYRFIPRSIWNDKPIQYGIQSINVLLGTPESTMDAITPVGELLANFDYYGLIILPLYGGLAGFFENRRAKGINTLIYAGFIFSTVSTTMWMASTGLMSNLISMIICYFFFRIYIILVRPCGKMGEFDYEKTNKNCA